MIACYRGRLNVVQYLVQKANIDLEACGKRGHTGLMKASEDGRTEIVKYLITNTSVNVEARNCVSKLHY